MQSMLLSLLLSQFAGGINIKILAGMSIVALFIWKILQANGLKALKTIRKLFLIIFTLFFLMPYMKLSSVVINQLDSTFNINYLLSQTFKQYKGTDWANGLLNATFFFFYVGFVLYLWALEKKASAPPPEKPLKIEAKIGNIDPPKS